MTRLVLPAGPLCATPSGLHRLRANRVARRARAARPHVGDAVRVARAGRPQLGRGGRRSTTPRRCAWRTSSLRAQLEATHAQRMEKMPEWPIIFAGERDEIRFAAPLPARVQSGGIWYYRLHIADVDGKQSLVLDRMIPDVTQNAPPQFDGAEHSVLATGIAALSIQLPRSRSGRRRRQHGGVGAGRGASAGRTSGGCRGRSASRCGPPSAARRGRRSTRCRAGSRPGGVPRRGTTARARCAQG